MKTFCLLAGLILLAMLWGLAALSFSRKDL